MFIMNTKTVEYERQERASMKGENNPRWNGGTSDYPDHYLMKCNRIKKLKSTKNRCEICGNKATMIHHKDGKKDNHELLNLLSVCHKCHATLHAPRKNKTSKFMRLFGYTLNELSKKTGLGDSVVYSILMHPKQRKYATLIEFSKLSGISLEKILNSTNGESSISPIAELSKMEEKP